ncbi:four helix bundle protein [Telluribacter humicola]|uniref:four helix bundle protein n=1 Tax=Telluribacter humicola TaxID=1720261 RepID=UPI001A975AFD|nr:four helix bundle protein [Telluribacter humicola]
MNNETPKPNVVLDKSFAFSICIVKVNQYLYKNHKEILPLATQLLKSGTSIGANVEEAVSGYSKKDFSSKMGISLKEAKETRYWIRLLYETGYLDERQHHSLLQDVEELIKLLTSILKTSRAE